MKVADIKTPFSWKEPKVLLTDSIWYVPERCDDYSSFVFPGWNSEQIFNNDLPVKIEYCSGNGAWISAKASANQNCNWVAVEKRFIRLRKIAASKMRSKLSNLLPICGEAHNVTSRYFPKESVSEVYINFPDPWPKRRHAQNRLIQPSFLDEIHRILKDDGTITFVTDDIKYSLLTIEEFLDHKGFESLYPHPYYVTRRDDYGSSFFEEMWRCKGKEIRYHSFKKVTYGHTSCPSRST